MFIKSGVPIMFIIKTVHLFELVIVCAFRSDKLAVNMRKIITYLALTVRAPTKEPRSPANNFENRCDDCEPYILQKLTKNLVYILCRTCLNRVIISTIWFRGSSRTRSSTVTRSFYCSILSYRYVHTFCITGGATDCVYLHQYLCLV